MQVFWFFRLGRNLIAVGRAGCFGWVFLLFNLPVLLSVGGLGALLWWRMQQFPTPLVVGAGLVLLVETIYGVAVIASHASTNRPSVFAQVDEIVKRTSNIEEQRRRRVYAHIHALGEAARRAYEAQHPHQP